VKTALAGVVPLVLATGSGLVALAWRAASSAMHPGVGTYPWTPADFPTLAADKLRIQTSTGASLEGRLFHGPSRATVVLSHGYGGTQDEVLPVADALHRAGFTIFTYDLRGCGGSTGEITFGAREQDDLASVVDELARRPDVDADRIGAFGFSMGGATTILAAAKEPRIKAVAADSAWTNAKSWLRPSLASVFLHPRDRFTTLSVAVLERRLGIDLDDLRPVDAIGGLDRPVLLIHGSADDVILPRDSEGLLAAAGPRAELWRVAGAGHGATLQRGGASTMPRLASFFERTLE
jgi:pimeloyl-ACP methyl ester carboxylesterase